MCDLKELFPEGSFDHSCLVVKDIQKTYDEFAKIPGAVLGPIHQTDEADFAKPVYRGKPSQTRAYQFFVTFGSLRTEVLQPDENPNVWTEVLERQGGDSIHHVGFSVESSVPVVEFFKTLGIEVVQTGNYKGGRYTYLDTLDRFGMMIELLESV